MLAPKRSDENNERTRSRSSECVVGRLQAADGCWACERGHASSVGMDTDLDGGNDGSTRKGR